MIAQAQSNVHVAEKRAEESERRAKEEDLRRSKVAAESAGVQQSIIQVGKHTGKYYFLSKIMCVAIDRGE